MKLKNLYVIFMGLLMSVSVNADLKPYEEWW